MKIITVVSFALYVCGCAGTHSQPFTEHEVSFRNGSVELSGTLILPDKKESVPVIVFLHGSGPHERAGFRHYAEEFATLGIAGLFFDKRGTGSSGGSWVNSSLDDLADDALAAVQFLTETESIHPNRIGIWGVSQAAWVAPLAASKSHAIAFMILISGGGATPRESELFSYEKAFEHAGLSETEKADAFKMLDVYFDYLATGEGRRSLISRLEALGESSLKPLAEQLLRIVPSEANRYNWSWVANYDPASHIGKMKMPVLLMFGDQDTDHPTELAIERWREGLANAGNEKVTIMVFPGAGHGIRMREEHTGRDKAPFAEGYEAAMREWLERHVVDGEK